MSTRSSTRNPFPPLDNPELTIRRRTRVDPNLLNDFNMATNGNSDDIPPAEGGDLPVPDIQTMEELCQPTLNGRVQNSCQFHELPGDDANKHLDKFLHVTQSIKVNGVTDDALRLYLFPHSLTHHATAWFDRLSRNSITTFEQMAKTFLEKSFPPSMVTKLRNEITNFCQCLDESLFEARECYKHSIDRETFMKRRPEECYYLIKNMTAHHNDWDTSAQRRTLPSNTITNPMEDLKGITTRSGIAYKGPTIPTTSFPPKVVERKTEVTKDTVPPTNNESTKDIQPLVIQFETQVPNSKLVVALVVEPIEAPISALKPNPKPSIPYPSRLHDQKLHDKANDQKEKFFQIFQDLNFNISFGDPRKFLIPYDFTGMDECLALADPGASINLMPLSVCKMLSLSELCPTCMTLELADRPISYPVRVAEYVFVKAGKFHFPADFVVVDIDADPRVPLIIERSFLKTGRALIDVYEGELTLRVDNKVVTFNLDQTARYSSNYDDMSVNRIDVIDVACEEYSQEVLGFSVSGNPTPSTKPIVSISSPTITPFGDSDFHLEEIDAFLTIEDEPISPKIDNFYYDSKGDILLLEEFHNDDPSSPPLSPQELKVFELKNEKSSIDEPPVVKIKDLPPHLKYAFLGGDDKLPVIIAKDLKDEEKTALIKVLKSHKQALAWQHFDIKGIDPKFYTHKILMEDDFKPVVQHQRRVNPKIHEVTKKEVLKLLDAELIYPISDSPWVSLVHCVPKKVVLPLLKMKKMS
nr:reverse transcriptase domain-containing protein [Tanacetum cinerariifolium]